MERWLFQRIPIMPGQRQGRKGPAAPSPLSRAGAACRWEILEGNIGEIHCSLCKVEGHHSRNEKLRPGPGCSHQGKWELEQSNGAGMECGSELGCSFLPLLFSEDMWIHCCRAIWAVRATTPSVSPSDTAAILTFQGTAKIALLTP